MVLAESSALGLCGLQYNSLTGSWLDLCVQHCLKHPFYWAPMFTLISWRPPVLVFVQAVLWGPCTSLPPPPF